MKRTRNSKPAPRNGTVLLVVVVIIVLLSLGTYTFTELSVAESEATAMFGRGVHARAFADSGIEVAATLISDPNERRQSNAYLNRPELFSGILLRESPVRRGRGRFSVVAPLEQDSSGRLLRYGLVDESGKLNLNAITGFKLDADTSRNLFMRLPNMTFEIADAILDWLDSDDTPRQFGVESDYYSSLPQPYRSANGPLTSLDELLLVRGVSPGLLWGQDLNHNGLLDPGENLNGGTFDRGWSAYLTIYSSERNLRQDGTARINLNHQNLPELYDRLSSEMGEPVAKFVTAYRMRGARTSGQGGSGSGSGSGRSGGGGGSAGGNTAGGNSSRGKSSPGSSGSGGSTSGGGSGSGGNSASNSGSGGSGSGGNGGGGGGGASAAGSTTVANPSAGGRGGNTVQRGGMDVAQSGSVTIKSIYELIGVQTTAQSGGKSTTLTSPWASSVDEINKYLPDLLEKASLTDNTAIPGRINANQASFAVLMGVPSMTEDLARKIVDSQNTGGISVGGGSSLTPRSSNAWLVAEGVTDVTTMKALDPYLNGRGDVYRAQSVGFFDEGGPVTRLEAVIDSSVQPVRIVMIRDLSELGRGYSSQQLGVP